MDPGEESHDEAGWPPPAEPDLAARDDVDDDELDALDQLEDIEADDPGDGTASDDPFFISKQAAAVFKHRLLQVYFPKFVGKAGSTEADKRLVYVDTHAGRGVYDDGTAGSPLLIAKSAAGMAARRVDCVFIERRRTNHAELRRVLTEQVGPPEGPPIMWSALRGTASANLAEALRFADNSPLFMFVDPYGLGLTFEQVVQVLNRKREGWGRKTEVLLNFISGAVRRPGGYLHIDDPNPQQLTTLRNMDLVLGDDSWREVYLSAETLDHAVSRIAAEYAERVRAATGATWTLVPVQNRAHQYPLYWLLHFTFHPSGSWWIREAASQAGSAWRRFLNPPPTEFADGLFTADDLDPFPAEEKRREADWVDLLEQNARALLTRQVDINVHRDQHELFGDAFGQAWSKHLQKALLRLHKDGLLDPRPYSKDFEKYVGRRR